MNEYDSIISSCSNLIYMIINRFFKGYDIEDLYQVGVIGVIKAYKNYKENKMCKFSTYAYKYIYGEIYSYVNSTKSLKTSKDLISLYKKINEAKNILSQKLMKEPSLKELSNFLEIDEYIINSAILAMEKVDSLDKVIYEGENSIRIFDKVRDNRDYYNVDYMLLNDEISKLPSPEKEIIYLRYYEDRTQSEVAKILGINQVGVSRMESKTLKKIKTKYQNVA